MAVEKARIGMGVDSDQPVRFDSPNPPAMNMKLVLAALAASVAAFLLGWGIYGIALHSYSGSVES